MWPTSRPDPYSSLPSDIKVLDKFREGWNTSHQVHNLSYSSQVRA